jgi:hypothetical protein
MRGPRAAAAALLVLLAAAACDAPPFEARPGEPGDTLAADSGTSRPYLILLSLDGFRPDYLDQGTAALQRVVAGGTVASALTPVFPTLTFPNHYTQVTGLYPENHGIVGNSFWDPVRQASYSLGNRSTVMDGSWYRGEPIWVTAEKQGVRAASYFWVGSEAAIQGVRPSIWKAYDGSIPNAARVDSVLKWLRLPPAQRPHLVTLYMSTVDGAGHQHGPHSSTVRSAVAAVDQALGRLLDGIAALPQADSVYLMIMSDHGMARFETHQYESLAGMADLTGVRVATAGTFASLHVEPWGPRAESVRDELNAGLQRGRAYLREEVPERLRYRADRRIGDIVILMEEPWQILRGTGSGASGGNHGWDPESEAMQGILLVMGPTVPAGKRIGAVRAVDLYPFFTETLRLEGNPDIDGRAGALRAALEAERTP